MITKTTLLSNDKAAYVQKHCDEYECTIIEIGIAGADSVKLSITGPDNGMKRLFDAIEE